MKNTILISQIIHTRYKTDLERYLHIYFLTFKELNHTRNLLDRIIKEIKKPLKNNYFLSDKILRNNTYIKKFVTKDLLRLKKRLHDNKKDEVMEKINRYLLDNHEFIKYALNQWWLVNAGIIFEFLRIPETTEKKFILWLKKEFDVKPGNLVLYRHTISENGRRKLKSIKFNVPYSHWDESYTIDSIKEASKSLKKLGNCKGLWNEGSWLYDHKLYKKASDGKPYVAFAFLNNNLIYGHKFFLGMATPNNKYRKHYYFASRNPRRKKLLDSGELKISVYGLYYPKAELMNNIKNIQN